MDLRSAYDIGEPAEIRAGIWACAADVPWLPDLVPPEDATTSGRAVLAEALGRQVTMLHAVAAAAPRGTAVQLRLTSAGTEGSADRRTRIGIIVRGGSPEAAARVMRLVAVTLPPEFPLRPVAAGDIGALLTPFRFDAASPDQIVEVRRAPESLETFNAAVAGPAGAGSAGLIRPVVLPWSPSVNALSGSLMLLATSPEPCALCVHIEPARPSVPLLAYVDVTVQDIASISSLDQNPLAATALRAYRLALRELPRAALRMRVSLAARGTVPPGLAEGVGVDLTRAWEAAGGTGVPCAFDVVRPHDANDYDRAAGLFARLTAAPWRENADPRIAEMIDLVDVVQAAAAFRLPVSAQGGVPGVATTRLSSLPSAPELSRETGPGVVLGISAAGADVRLDLDELTRHVLVAGLPGFGKTTTTHSLLWTLTAGYQVPFLVIDPAKSDYRPLVRSLAAAGQDAALIEVRPDQVAMNPLAVPPNVSPLAHAQRVMAAFDAAFALSETFPAAVMLLGRAIVEAYRRAGASGTSPTLRSLYAVTAQTIQRAGYAGESAANIRAALLGRLEYLTEGPLGTVLSGDAAASVDWQSITRRPTVIELRGIPGPRERSLVFGLLAAGLISYREANPFAGELGHVTVLEEAHRLLPAEEGSANEGVRSFIEALAELRASGEGFIIVDQAPTRLAAGVTKLCGSLIVHRLVEAAERDAAGSAMVLDESQRADLARLSRGRALVYSPQRTAAVLCDVGAAGAGSGHGYGGSGATGGQPPVSVRHHLTGIPAVIEPMYCVGCPEPCRHAERGGPISEELTAMGPVALRTLSKAALERSDGHRGLARCAAAATLGSQLRDRPADLRQVLGLLDSALMRRAHDKGGDNQ
jgi:hypothetical protein